jgi:hypothetical protein
MCLSSQLYMEDISRRIVIQTDLGKIMRPYSESNQSKKGGGVGSSRRVLSKHETLSSNPSTVKKNRFPLFAIVLNGLRVVVLYHDLNL